MIMPYRWALICHHAGMIVPCYWRLADHVGPTSPPWCRALADDATANNHPGRPNYMWWHPGLMWGGAPTPPSRRPI